jgi:23S rRNA pseudouridine2605 synthase
MKERLQKILAKAGIASRRAGESFIAAGRVRVNGRIVSELGAQADLENDKIEVDGRRIAAEKFAYYMLHKPRGVVATLSDPEGRETIASLLKDVPVRVFPVGRLDFHTSGALLLTNDGDLAHALMHPSKKVAKVYSVKVTGIMEERVLDYWRKGVQLEDGMTAPASATLLRHESGKTWFELTLREGRNLQIRRMGEVTGYPVLRLARLSVAGVSCEGLRPGALRPLDHEELLTLRNLTGFPKRVPKVSAPFVAPSRGRAARNAASPAEARPGARFEGKSKTKVRANARGEDARPTRTRLAEGRSAEGRSAEGSSAVGSKARRERTSAKSGPVKSGSDRDNRESNLFQDRFAGARYGGGSPGRRSADTTDHWGGGVSRQSAGGGREGSVGRGSSRGESDERSGRNARTRTTGSSGGIHATGDSTSYRISKTRR